MDKFPVRKWSLEQETLVDHLQPKPIMVLHVDNSIKPGHEPAHKTYARTKGTPIQVGLEDRTDTLQPDPAKTTVVVVCPTETGISTRDAFMIRINGHQSDVASTIASKDPHNTFHWKCASEHTAGQSGSRAWRLHLPMQLLHTQVAKRIDRMLSHKMPQETGDDAAFRGRMKARKQLGADMMTERVIREINKEKQLLAEREPINVANWDEAITRELGHTNDDMTPTDLHPHLATMDTDGPHDQQPNNTDKPTHAHPRPPNQAQKTKAHNKTPQKTPTKTTPPPKKKKATPTSPQSNQQTDGTATFTADTKHKGKGKGTVKKPTGQRKKVRCLFLMPFIAIMALHLLLVPTTHTEAPVLLLPMIRRVRRRYTLPLRHRQ